MTIEQIRARLAEIAASIEGIQAGAEGFTEEQQSEIEGLSSEFDTLNKQLETAEKVESMKARAVAPSGRKTTAAGVVVPAPERTQKNGGFENAGAFLMAVKKASQTGEIDKRFNAATMKESVGEDGGFLVPEEISNAILKKLAGDESLMAKTTALQVGGNNLTLTVDENQPWSGGVTAYWTAEGSAITESKASFKQASWRLHKLAALVKATDELLDDAVALESYIMASAPNAIMHQINKAILTGNGIGKPLGIINSSFAVTVAAEGGQSADTVNAVNVIKMYSRMFPSARANAVWYINPAVEEQLRQMQDPNGAYIYLTPGSQMNQSPYATLLGRPVMPLMAGMPALGDVGDIIFADLSYFYMIRKASGVKSATSIHLHFDKEITSFRFSLRVDGKCPFQSPVTTEFGNYQMSAFVLLAAR